MEIAVCLEETDLGGLCRYCGKFSSNWKIKHKIHCDKKTSPNYDLIEADKERDKFQFSQIGYCSLCN